MNYTTILDGILDLKSYKKEHFTTTCNIIDGQFQQCLLNRDSLVLKYQSKLLDTNGSPYTVNDIFGNPVLTFGNEWETITLRQAFSGTGSNPDTTSAAIYPFCLFSRLINIVTGSSNAFQSSILDPTAQTDENGIISNAAYHMITNGTYLRGFPYDITLQGDQGASGYINFASLSISIEKLFKSFDAMFNLGLGIEYTEQGKPYVRVENKEYFYQPIVILQIDELSDLIYVPDETFLFNGVEVGYAEFTNDNKYGMQEYNNKTEYSTPLIPFDKKLSIISEIRADATGIEQLRSESAPVNPTQELKLDNKIYVVSCFNSATGLASLKQETTIITNVYASAPIIFNADIAPGQMLYNWANILTVGLQNNKFDSLIFQHSKRPVNVATRKMPNGNFIGENQDIPITDLLNIAKPYLSGWKAQFNAPLGIPEIQAIEKNKNGLVAFFDYTSQQYKFGWIREVSTDPVDKTTTWELQMSNFLPTFAPDNNVPSNKNKGPYPGTILPNPSFPVYDYELEEDGSFSLDEDGGLLLEEQQAL
jgi:hypothetical protein